MLLVAVQTVAVFGMVVDAAEDDASGVALRADDSDAPKLEVAGGDAAVHPLTANSRAAAPTRANR